MATYKREELVKIGLEGFVEIDKQFPPTKWNSSSSSTPPTAINKPTQVYSQTTFGMTRYQQPQNPLAYQVMNQVYYNSEESFEAEEKVKVVAYYETNTRPFPHQYSRVPFTSPPSSFNQRPTASNATEKPKIMRSGGMLLFGFPKRNNK